MSPRNHAAVIGSLASCDLGMAELLLRAGVETTVLRPITEQTIVDLDPEIFPRVALRGIQFFSGPVELASRLREFDIVFSFTSALVFHLARLRFLLRHGRRLGWPPWINICTGSDITERAVARTRAGSIQRSAFRSAFVNVIPAYPWALRNAVRVGLRNAIVLPFPYRPIDIEPAPLVDRQELVLLHAAHIDWGETDDAPGRTSTKGTDRFLRAFVRFVKDTPRPVRLVLVDRGADRGQAKALLDASGVADRVQWREPMTHSQLYQAVQDADVVVDQFDVGGLGAIAWESMALGRPVLAYIHPAYDALTFGEPTPVFNACTESEIEAALHEIADPCVRARRSEEVRTWMKSRRHGNIDRYLYYTALATGRWSQGLPASSHPTQRFPASPMAQDSENT